VTAALAGLGVPPSEMAGAADKVEGALRSCLADKRARWIFDAHAEAECECEMTGWLDGRYERIRIDRTFVDGDGVRWLIDYKTSAHEGGGRAAFLENEKLRYRDQMERYARLIGNFDSRPVRVALYFPLLGEWLEWQPFSAMAGARG